MNLKNVSLQRPSRRPNLGIAKPQGKDASSVVQPSERKLEADSVRISSRHLSQAGEKLDPDSIKEALRESQQQGLRTALIIGGGPAGLAAAITLTKKFGVKTTVVEARANDKGEPMHARPHQISLRKDSLESLKELGAYDDVMARSGFIDKEITVQARPDGEEISVKRPTGQTSGRGKTFLHPGMLDSDSVSQMRISDGEKALYAEAKRLGIEVRAGEVAELTHDPSTNNYSATSRKADFSDKGVTLSGPKNDLGTPDLVVVADGAGSPTREALGIEFKGESESKHYLGGLITKGIGAETRKVATQEPGFERHVMATGHSVYGDTWVSVEVSPQEAALPPEERIKLLASKANYAMPEENVSEKDIGWGAGHVTSVQNRRAERTTAGNNVVLIGDAAGTGSVWVGGDLNLALTTHLKAVEHLAKNLKTPGRHRERSMQIFDRTVQWGTTRWHRAGASQLKSN